MDYYEKIKQLLRVSMQYVNRAHDSVLDETVSDSVALAYLNYAAAKTSVAESFYYSKYDELENDEIENYFRQFDILAHEMLNNCYTKHSHQWTNIEYETLKKIFDESFFAFDSK